MEPGNELEYKSPENKGPDELTTLLDEIQQSLPPEEPLGQDEEEKIRYDAHVAIQLPVMYYDTTEVSEVPEVKPKEEKYEEIEY